MNIHKLITPRTAHYYTLNPTKEIKAVLIVIHGYAQSADEFIHQFSHLCEEGILVVAPEGLSKFYGKKRLAVASWMTNLHREDEIIDYNQFIESVFAEIAKSIAVDKIAILGFSQGVSTMFRWCSYTELKKLKVFACCGTVPPELNAKSFNSKEVHLDFYYGDNDPLFSLEKAQENLNKLKELKINFNSTRYLGTHEIPSECLRDVSQWANG